MAQQDSDEPLPGEPAFWDEKYDAAEEAYLFGEAPNAFVQEAASRYLSAGAEVVELGAGEGRNAVYLARAHGAKVTVVDFSERALEHARRLAERLAVSLETVQADVLDWTPRRQWEAVIVTFLQPLPHERPRLYERIQAWLRPGGVLLAEWFRPAQLRDGYESGGPPTVDRMISAEELRIHFPAEGIRHCEETVTMLEEGEALYGEGAVVQFVFEKPAMNEGKKGGG